MALASGWGSGRSGEKLTATPVASIGTPVARLAYRPQNAGRDLDLLPLRPYSAPGTRYQYGRLPSDRGTDKALPGQYASPGTRYSYSVLGVVVPFQPSPAPRCLRRAPSTPGAPNAPRTHARRSRPARLTRPSSTRRSARRSETPIGSSGVAATGESSDDRGRACEVRAVPVKLSGRSIAIDGERNGGIRVTGWAGDSVRVTARIQAQARTDAVAQSMLPKIRVIADGRGVRPRDPPWTTTTRPGGR